VCGLRLQQGLADFTVVARIGVTGGECLFHQHVDGDAVLGVHHGEPAVVGAPLHGPQDLPVVAVEDTRIRHEQLERGDSFLDEQIHLLERVLGDIGEDHVEAVVDGALAVGLGVPGVQAFAQGPADALHGEVDDGRGAAPSGRTRTGLEGVGGGRAAERHLHVGVRVHATRDDVLPRGVDDGVRRPTLRQRAALGGQCDDLLTLDQDVRPDLFGGGDDKPTTYDGTGHDLSSFLSCFPSQASVSGPYASGRRSR
jgi:hypothetical protein